jgi:hypothetical protein
LTLDLRNRLLGIPRSCGTPVKLTKTTFCFVQPKLINVFVVTGIQALNQPKR